MHSPTATEGIPFGRYRIRRRLGMGGMGEVFLADQLGPLGPVRPVALKRMHPSLAHDPAYARRFLQEMAIAARLNHSNIAVTHDFGEIDGVYYMAMEYIDGASMDQVLDKGPIPIAAALLITRKIAEALAYAHERTPPVVHQDVSPHNIMLGTAGEVKLLDFGIAAAEAAAQDKLRVKAPYASPEQLRGLPPQRNFDLWALGIVLYEMLTGRRPFPGPAAKQVFAQIERRSLMPVEALVPSAAGASQLIRRALDLRGHRRWSSARAFAEACDLLLARREAEAQQILAARAKQSRPQPAPPSVDDWPSTSTVSPNAAAKVDVPDIGTDDAIAEALVPRSYGRWLAAGFAAVIIAIIGRTFLPTIDAFTQNTTTAAEPPPETRRAVGDAPPHEIQPPPPRPTGEIAAKQRRHPTNAEDAAAKQQRPTNTKDIAVKQQRPTNAEGAVVKQPKRQANTKPRSPSQRSRP
ncbi:MAG: serine/threonine-protein kinase, partial [Myxococcota bacterium]